MRDYQFIYDDGTMIVYNLTDHQYTSAMNGILQGLNAVVDVEGGVMLKLADLRSIFRLPEPVEEAGESFEPEFDPEVVEFLRLQRMAEESMNTPDDADYKGGITL